jgi:hypothetical protein
VGRHGLMGSYTSWVEMMQTTVPLRARSATTRRLSSVPIAFALGPLAVHRWLYHPKSARCLAPFTTPEAGSRHSADFKLPLSAIPTAEHIDGPFCRCHTTSMSPFVPGHGTPDPHPHPHPRFAGDRARATSCSDPLGCALRRLEPEAWNHRGECSRTQRIMPAASADGGARGGVWSLQHERGEPAPAPRMPARAPLRSTIGVQASPHVALGWQDSAQSSHPPKRELSQEQLERMETNRQKALAKRQATELHGLLRSSSQCVACKE